MKVPIEILKEMEWNRWPTQYMTRQQIQNVFCHDTNVVHAPAIRPKNIRQRIFLCRTHFFSFLSKKKLSLFACVGLENIFFFHFALVAG